MNNIKFFKNNFLDKHDNIYILDNTKNYADNFGKQWKTYQKTQIDSENKFNISKDFFYSLVFNNPDKLKNKNILEIGCGPGRFTEHILKYSKECVSIDLSNAIFYNVCKNYKNLNLIKADINKLIPNMKFDIVFCRGMLQHTPDPFKTLINLYKFIDNSGTVYFDIYKLPKIGYLHPKYFFWRPLISFFVKYEDCELFLEKHIDKILIFKRLIKKIFLNSNFISDIIIPVWDYDGRINLNKKQLKEWAILDTLDGIYAKYDKPKSFKKIKKFLNENNIKIQNYNSRLNCFETHKL